jgi:hypothetical protein
LQTVKDIAASSVASNCGVASPIAPRGRALRRRWRNQLGSDQQMHDFWSEPGIAANGIDRNCA